MSLESLKPCIWQLTGGIGFSAFHSRDNSDRYPLIISYDLDYTADRHVDLQVKKLLLPTLSLDALSEFHPFSP
jgi:hypothetical protein